MIKPKLTNHLYLPSGYLTMERNEAAASIQPQQSHFYEAEIFWLLASSEAGFRLRPKFMVGQETFWVGPSSSQVWST